MSADKELNRELLAACKAQHNAIVNLLAVCEALQLGYAPSNEVLAALVAARKAIIKASRS